MGTLRRLCDRLRRHQVRSVTEAPAWGDKIERGILNTITAHVLAAAATPDTEVARDVWRLRVFGMHGAELDFRPVTQPWLREAAKRWAASDLPGRRGTGHGIASVLRAHVAAVTSLSESLRGGRSDHGDNPALLGRADIDHFVLRQQYLQNTGSSSGYTRERNCRMTRIVLTGARGIGLMRPGGPTAGLREDFTLGRSDMPAHPQPAEPCRDLPPQIMRQLCERLAELEGPVRVAVELLIDTGRRPAEICGLAWDCLARDDDGSPVLVYDNCKAHRDGRRLPVGEITAQIITEQKKRARDRYPDTAAGELMLLPSPARNRYGRRAMTTGWLDAQHRDWVDAMPPLLLPDGTEYPRNRIFPYAYRHTYAQRHADAGVPVDVLRELLDHIQLDTTRQYYRVGEKRRRDAVSKVTAMQFSRQGDRIWAQARDLLDTEHARAPSARSPSPTGYAPNRPTSRPTARPALTGSAAPAATISALTSPTCPTCRPTWMTCSAAANGCWPPPTSTPGPAPKRCPRKRKSAASEP
jgi:integrase